MTGSLLDAVGEESREAIPFEPTTDSTAAQAGDPTIPDSVSDPALSSAPPWRSETGEPVPRWVTLPKELMEIEHGRTRIRGRAGPALLALTLILLAKVAAVYIVQMSTPDLFALIAELLG